MGQQKQILDLDWLIKKYMPFFQQFGMEEKNIRSHYLKWSENRPALVKDYLWFIFQQLLFESAKQSHSESDLYKNQVIIYSEMLDFRRRIEKAKANEILQLRFEAEIRQVTSDTNLLLEIEIISGYCCPYCDSLNNQILK